MALMLLLAACGEKGEDAKADATTMTADLGGFTLISEHFDDKGKLMWKSTFQSADDVSLAAEEFTPPSGYERQTRQGMMNR